MNDFHVRQKQLFVEKNFIGHSETIECDALTSLEWKCIARMIYEKEPRPFQAAIGIPDSGLELGRWLNEYSTQNPEHPYLICDDVLTTGGTMDYFEDQYFRNRTPHGYFGWVVFAKIKPPQPWINALFQMPTNR